MMPFFTPNYFNVYFLKQTDSLTYTCSLNLLGLDPGCTISILQLITVRPIQLPYLVDLTEYSSKMVNSGYMVT